MFAHIEASLQSNESNKRYCEQHGLVPATFYYWLKKYKEEQPEKYLADTSGGFIPINVEKDPAPEADQRSEPSQLHFLFPNGVQVKCPDTVTPQVLKTLINP